MNESRMVSDEQVARRAERDFCALCEMADMDCDITRKFMNRLSDFLFSAARYAAEMNGTPCVPMPTA